jgi:hypothetical protein
VIVIAGRSVQLPPDAHVDGVIMHVTCIGSDCPQVPLYRIRRGNSVTTVSLRSAKMGPRRSRLVRRALSSS